MKRFTFDSNEVHDKLFISITSVHGIISTVGPGMRVVGFEPGHNMVEKNWLETIIDHICSCYRHRALRDAELEITIEGNMRTEAYTIRRHICEYFPFAKFNDDLMASNVTKGVSIENIAKLINTDQLRVMENPVTKCLDIEDRLQLRGQPRCQCPICPNLGALMLMAAFSHQ